MGCHIVLSTVTESFNSQTSFKSSCRGAGKFFWFGFIIFLTLNLMCFYGVMGVYITPDLIVGTVLSAFFYGFWCATDGARSGSCMPALLALAAVHRLRWSPCQPALVLASMRLHP